MPASEDTAGPHGGWTAGEGSPTGRSGPLPLRARISPISLRTHIFGNEIVFDTLFTVIGFAWVVGSAGTLVLLRINPRDDD